MPAEMNFPMVHGLSRLLFVHENLEVRYPQRSMFC
jgi:hypothetical protein